MPRGQITIGVTQFPGSLNPYQSQDTSAALIESGMFSSYAYFDGHGRLVPDLLADIPSVKNHEVLDGGRTVILRLKPHRYWSSGAEITSADVVFGWKVDRDPQTGPACVVNGCIVRSMRALDRYTLVARLSHAPLDTVGFWLPDLVPSTWSKLGQSPRAAAKVLYQDSSFDYEWPGPENWVSGPYRLQDIVLNKRVVLGIAPHSARSNEPHVARMVYQLYSSSAELIGGLASGAVDIATNFAYTDLSALRKAATGHFRLVVQPTPTLEHLELNVASGQLARKPNPLTDIRVRQALALATDRMELLREVSRLGPLETRDLVAYSPWMAIPDVTEAGADRTITGAWDPIVRRYLPYGPESIRDARTLLARAGYPQGLNLEINALNTRLAFRQAEAQLLTQDWGQVGVRLSVQEQPNKGPCSGFEVPTPLQAGDFQVALFAWENDLGATPLRSELRTYDPGIPARPGPCTQSDRGENYAGISDRQIDLTWKKAESVADAGQRNALYRRIQERVIKQAYWIPLYWRPAISAVSLRVKGFGQAGELATWRPQDWSLGS